MPENTGDVFRASRGEGRKRLEAVVLIANLVFVGIVVLYLLAVKVGSGRVQPLVEADAQTAQRIRDLELALQRNPGNYTQALELARLYQDVGEFPWSYDALRKAEQGGGLDSAFRLRLGLAYVELGKNEDGLRVLKAAADRCHREECFADVRVKLDVFSQVATLFVDRRIDSRKQLIEAEAALREILKPVQVDLAKMRPKAPALPPPAAAEPQVRRSRTK
jgi:hypothetical protein